MQRAASVTLGRLCWKTPVSELIDDLFRHTERPDGPRDAAVWHEFCRDVIGALVEGPRPYRGSGPSFGADRSAEPAEPGQVFLRSVFT